MIIEEIVSSSVDNAKVRRRVISGASTDMCHLLAEASKILKFKYDRGVHDPKPRVLVLGRWLHPKTSNALVAGLNLNYLNDDEIDQLRDNIGLITKPDSLKNKYWTGRSLLPKIWRKAWRTYDEKFIRLAKAVEFEPTDSDYQTSQSKQVAPEPDDKRQQKELDKLKATAANVAGDAPKKPEGLGSKISRLSKDTLRRLADLVKRKLFRNRSKAKAKEADDVLDIEREKQAEIEKEKEEAADLDMELKDLESDDMTEESYDRLAESVLKPKNLVWKNSSQYVHWHSIENFCEHQDKLRGSILDYSHGTSVHIIHNTITGDTIVDLADHISEVLSKAGWDWDHTIRTTIDDSISIEYPEVINEGLIEDYHNSDEFVLAQLLSEITFQ